MLWCQSRFLKIFQTLVLLPNAQGEKRGPTASFSTLLLEFFRSSRLVSRLKKVSIFLLCGFILSGFGVRGYHKSSLQRFIDFHPIATKISDMPVAKNILIPNKPKERESFSFPGYFGDLLRFKPHVPSLSGTFSRKDGPRCSHSRWWCGLRFIGNRFVLIDNLKADEFHGFYMTRGFPAVEDFHVNKIAAQCVKLLKMNANPGPFRGDHDIGLALDSPPLKDGKKRINGTDNKQPNLNQHRWRVPGFVAGVVLFGVGLLLIGYGAKGFDERLFKCGWRSGFCLIFGGIFLLFGGFLMFIWPQLS